MRNVLLMSLCGLLLFSLPAVSEVKEKKSMDISVANQKFVLPNGLTVIVHEDHKAPIVAFNIWYHVGSKNERLGKTGFAHLFEHLMFNGSEHYNDDYFKPFESVGATDMNGTTDYDRTNYFENVPRQALDVALWMESDRMGHMLGAITQAKLDEQRGVVQNELRQGENQPYGKVEGIIARNTFPYGHPYSWDVGGSIEDLNSATLTDVQDWFKTYYGPSNAVVVIAGDIDARSAREKTETYFGSIPAGSCLTRHQIWIAKRTGTIRQKTEDRVPQSRIYKVWNIPPWGSVEGEALSMVADILGSGKNSRLYKRLVYDDQIATSVSATADLREIAGQFVIQATARPGQDPAQVEKAIDEELSRFLKNGADEQELKRVKTQRESGFIRGIERIGGFGGKSDILATNQVYAGTPDFYLTSLRRQREVGNPRLLETAREWLSDGVYVLEVHPFPDLSSAKTDVDRTRLPAPGAFPEIAFPALQKTTLANGLRIVLAERHATPLVDFTLLVDAGTAADQFAVPGTASLTMATIDEGTKTRSSLQISEELEMLGSELAAYSGIDSSVISLSVLKPNLDAALDVYADVILRPQFPEKEFLRLQKQLLARIQQEKSNPVQIALRLLPGLLYGKTHAYGNPLTGSGTEESVSAIRRRDLVSFYESWFKPNNATLIVVGDTTLEEIVPRIEKILTGWKGGTVPRKNIQQVPEAAKPAFYLIDKPGAPQSVVIAGQIAPPRSDPGDIAMETMNNILGGNFSSRINMNLREDKHWSYGAGSLFYNTRAQRPFIAYAPVQTDKTGQTVSEIIKEVKGLQGLHPVSPEELTRTQNNQTLQLPGSWETIEAVSGAIGELVTFGLPDDYFKTYPGTVRALTVDEITAIARKVLRPDRFIWIIVGDRSKIEKEIRSLAIGDINLIDSNGKIVL